MKPTANRHQPSHRHPSFLYSYDFTYKDKMAEENVPAPAPTRMSVFGKSIPKELITEVIQNSSYYQQYLEIVARKPTAKEGGQKKTAFEAEKPKKPTPVKKPEPAKQTKPVKEKSTKPAPSMKTRKGKRRIPVTKEASTRPSTQLKDDTSANIVHETPSPPDAETGVEAKMSNSKGDTEILNVGEEKGEDISNTMALEERTVELDEGQARSCPTKKGKKDKPHVIPYCRFTKLIICHLGRKHNLHQRSESLLHLAEEDHRLRNLKFVPKGEDDEVFGMQIPNELIMNNIRNAPYFNADLEMVAKHDQKTAAAEGGKKKSATNVRGAYTQRTLVGDTNIIADLEEEQKDPLSSFTNLSSMKNLDDAYNIGDQFIDDKLTEDEPGKLNVESEIVYMVTVPVYQADTSVPPLSTLVIEISSPISPYPVHRQPNHYSNNLHISHSKDVGAAHLPKIKTPATWLRPLPEEDKPESPEPDWTVPSNDLPELENNWENALAKSYKDPAENKLLQKIGDMGSFIKWFCKRLGKKKLSKSDLEGPTFKPDVSKPLPKRSNQLKAANYPDFRLEELVPSLWIESERDYNISATYGITHWWFKIKEFYITRHNAPSDRMNQISNADSGIWLLGLDDSSLMFKYDPHAFNCADNMANENVPSSFTATTETTSTLPPPPPPPQQSTVHRDICIHSEDGNPARANIKQALGLHKDGDADASFHFRNSDKYYHDPEECEYAGPKVTTSHEGNIPQQG
ncbi:hypothetical protein Tco_0510983 [Tanacetum coccineum]